MTRELSIGSSFTKPLHYPLLLINPAPNLTQSEAKSKICSSPPPSEHPQLNLHIYIHPFTCNTHVSRTHMEKLFNSHRIAIEKKNKYIQVVRHTPPHTTATYAPRAVPPTSRSADGYSLQLVALAHHYRVLISGRRLHVQRMHCLHFTVDHRLIQDRRNHLLNHVWPCVPEL